MDLIYIIVNGRGGCWGLAGVFWVLWGNWHCFWGLLGFGCWCMGAFILGFLYAGVSFFGVIGMGVIL